MDYSEMSLFDFMLSAQGADAPFGKTIPADRVLVLSPHHDDEALGCGGTILKYLEQGASVCIIYLTDGRYGTAGRDASIRKDEAVNAWKAYNNVRQIFWDFTDSQLNKSVDEAVKLLTGIIIAEKPQVIFTPWIFDRHSDHTVTGVILYKALTILNGEDCRISSYEVASPVFANHIVNITKQWDMKMCLMDAYGSQSYLNIKEFIPCINQYRAKLARFKAIKAAEGFFVTSNIGYMHFIEAFFNQKQKLFCEG